MADDIKHDKAVIEIVKDGPMKISGRLNLSDSLRGINEESNALYLCLCGKTKRQPYCDGSHRKH